MSSVPRRFSRSGALVAGLLALALVAGGCSPDPIEVEVEPERAETCSDLIPTGTALAVQLLAAIEGVPIDVLTGDTPPEGPLAELLAIGEKFDAKADSLGCDPAELNREIMEEVGDRIEPGSFAGVILLEIMQGGASGATTTSTEPPSEDS